MSLRFQNIDQNYNSAVAGNRRPSYLWTIRTLLLVFFLSGCSDNAIATIKLVAKQSTLRSEFTESPQSATTLDLASPDRHQRKAVLTPASDSTQPHHTTLVSEFVSNPSNPTGQPSHRPTLKKWPSEAEKRRMKANAIERCKKKLLAIRADNANKEGISFLADKKSAYEVVTAKGTPKTESTAMIVGERIQYDRDGVGSLTLQVSIELPRAKVRSKPARFTKVGALEQHAFSKVPKFIDEDFPALLPWSEYADFPKSNFLVTYYQGEKMERARIRPADRAASWLDSLRLLNKTELLKLLNQDPSDVLSKTARKHYQEFLKALPMMMGQQGKSLVILQQDLLPILANDSTNGLRTMFRLKIPSGDEQPTYAPDFAKLQGALRAKKHREFSGIYPVSEIPNGQMQVWMNEDQLSDIDQVNGIELRGKLFVAVRGYERGRYFYIYKWQGWPEPKIKFAEDWGKWVVPATRIGVFNVKVDQGKTEWIPVQPRKLSYQITATELSDWSFTKAEKDKLFKMLNLSSRELKEKPKWSALPF